MKKSLFMLTSLLLGAFLLASCNDYETYGDKKKKERKAISSFISNQNITVITETEFENQGRTTSTEKNEYVYLNNSGVYMQIVRQGCGDMLKETENLSILCRFIEICLQDSSGLSNYSYPYDVDKLTISKTGSTITGYFTEGLMMDSYSSATVLTGWLIPLNYIKVGRPVTADDEIAKVRLIVPHNQGNQTAQAYTYPYYYEITFERE